MKFIKLLTIFLILAPISAVPHAHETGAPHWHQDFNQGRLVVVDTEPQEDGPDNRNLAVNAPDIDIGDFVFETDRPTSSSEPPVYTTPATLYVSRCTPPDLPTPPPGAGGGGLGGGGGSPLRFFCGNKPAHMESTIRWNIEETPRAMASDSGKVRFGPFKLIRKGRGGIAGASDTYRITILARSPAIYAQGQNGNGQFIGANPRLRAIALEEFILTGSTEQIVYVTAEVPSVFNAIKIVAEVDDEISGFPAACSQLPSTTSSPESFDSECLQLSINPLAAVTLNYIPIGMVYEPPGNCSWSNLTNAHTTGVTLSASRASSTSSHFISDSGFFWENEHIDSLRTTTNATDSSVGMSVTMASTFGTRLGTPTASPGDPRCNAVENPPPPREASGPGFGEVFLLLHNAPLIFWDTGTFRGAALSPTSNPNRPASIVPVSANAVRTGTGLPPGITFTDEERDAILGLSAFSVDADGSATFKLSDRFLPIGQPIHLPTGQAYEYTENNQSTVGNGRTLTAESKRLLGSSTESDPVVDVTMSALQALMEKGAQEGAEKGLVAINPGFAAFAGDLAKKIKVPTLYQDQSTTTVNTSISSSDRISQVADDNVSQQFYIQDSNEGMSVSLYYDRLFGAYLFLPLEEGSGAVLEPGLINLPTIVVDAFDDEIEVGAAQLTRKQSTLLENVGAFAMNPASNSTYAVTDGRSKLRMMSTVAVDPPSVESMRVPIVQSSDNQPSQTLYIAEDESENPVALIWVNTTP